LARAEIPPDEDDDAQASAFAEDDEDFDDEDDFVDDDFDRSRQRRSAHRLPEDIASEFGVLLELRDFVDAD
jgi:hypothetical protein